MKNRILVLVTAFMLIGTHVYAANGDLIVNGNLGIGTPSPQSKLEILGANNARITESSQSGTNGLYSDFLLRGTFSNYPADTSRRNVGLIRSGFSTGIWNTGYLSFGVAGSDCTTDGDTDPCSRMIITNNGKVGIGTTGPGYKLDVAGDIRAQNAWLRTTGNTGWYSDTYGGGWYMADTSRVRSYNGKNVWVDATLGSNGGLTVGYGGAGSPAGGAIISGNVGIGTTNPASAKLQVVASGATAISAITDSSIGIASSANTYGVYASGWVGVFGSGSEYDFYGTGGEYARSGVWTNASDRNIKENYVNVDHQSILDKISQLPMTQWNYKSDVNKSKHVGPIAQDFYAIFGLGDDEKHVSTIDPAGIALVGVKALNEKIQDQQKQIDELRAEIKAMKKQR